MGDDEMRAKNVQAKADVTVTLRGVDDSTSVRPVVGIGATWTNAMLGQQAARSECVSNGKLEGDLIAALKGL